MNHSAFDDHLKKQFGDFQPEVPPHIWENIVNNRHKRRPVAWWNRFLKNGKILFTLSAILLGTAGYFLFVRNNKDIPSSGLSTNNLIPAHTQSQTTSSLNQQTTHNQQHSSHSTDQPVHQTAPGTDQPATSGQPSGTSQSTDPVTANKRSDNDSRNPVSSNHTSNKQSRSSQVTSQQYNRTNAIASSSLTPANNKNNRLVVPNDGVAGQSQDPDDGLTANTNKRKLKKDRQRSSVIVSTGETGDEPNTSSNPDQTTLTPAGTGAGMADLNRHGLPWVETWPEDKMPGE